MTVLSAHAERWHSLASSELARIRSKVPESIVLSVWWSESKGTPGEINPDSGASGLGQITPIALRFYNDQNNTLIAMADMRDTENPLLQARVSVWLLNWNARRVAGFQKGLPDRDLLLLALLSYHQGWKAVRQQLYDLSSRGLPVTWQSLKTNVPVSAWQGKAPTYAYHEHTLANAERICIETPIIEAQSTSCFDGGVDVPIPPAEPILKDQKTILWIAAGLVLAGLIVGFLSLIARGGK